MSDKLSKGIAASILAVAFYLIFGLASPIAAKAETPEVRANYRPQTDGIQVIWAANFKPDDYSLSGKIKNSGGGEFVYSHPKDKITVVADPPLNPKKVTFTAVIPYGPNQTLNERTEYAYLTVSASSGSGDALQSAKAELTLNLDSIKEHLALLDKLSRCVETDSATLSTMNITNVSDRSITVQLRATQTIKVNLLAFENPSTPPKKGDTSPFKIENKLLTVDILETVKIPSLREGKKYVVIVEEIDQGKNPPGRKLLWEPINMFAGQPLATKDQIKRPSLRVIGVPQPKRNQVVSVEISAENATGVTAYVITDDRSGNPFKLSEEVNIPLKPTKPGEPPDKTAYTGEIPVKLGEGNIVYKVYARAITNLTEEDNEAHDTSKEFNGLPSKLFTYASYEISNKQLRFTLEEPTPGTSLKTKVSVKLNGNALLTPCSKDGLSCTFEINSVLSALKPASSPGPTPQPSQPQRSLLIFEITAETSDLSERSQSISFAMAVTPPDPSDKDATKNWNKVTDFAKGLITGKDNSSIKAGNLMGTGLGGFLGALLKGFIL